MIAILLSKNVENMQLYYGGKVRHQAQSDDGIIEVVDLGDTRSLHFGTFPRQSSMSLRTPHELVLTYTQAMAAAFLLMPQPKRVLVVGLGGGSLVKFVLHHFPQCQIDVVEYRQDVMTVAAQYFGVPTEQESSRLKMYHGDGGAFVRQQAQREVRYDLLLVDAYDDTGMTESVAEQAFFDSCASVLTADGVMSMNLWGSEHALFGQTMSRINSSFSDQTLILPVKHKGNVICLASNADVDRKRLRDLTDQAVVQSITFGLDMQGFLHQIQRKHAAFPARLFGF